MVIFMKKKFLFSWVLGFFLFSALGAATTIDLEVSEQDAQKEADGTLCYSVTQQEPFFITITVKDSGQDDQDIKVEGLQQFQVMGQSQSSSMRMINQQISNTKTIQYQVLAGRQGTFFVGPAVIDGNEKIESKRIKIIVGAASNVASNRHAQGHGSAQPDDQKSFYTVVCKTNTDTKDVVIGQPIILSVIIFIQGPVANLSLQKPTIADFVVKEIKKEVTKQTQIKDAKGILIEKKFILFPLKTGIQTIEPFTVGFTVPARRQQRRRGSFGFFDDDFFSSFFSGQQQEQKTVASHELKISVQPLPQTPGKNIEGVGAFASFKASIDKTNASAHEPLLFTLTIDGKGNFDQMSAPKLNLPEAMRWYESKTDIQEDLTTQYNGGSKKFEFVVQCSDSGAQTIPAQTFTYFDTKTKTIRQLHTESIALTIQPRKGEEPKSIESDHQAINTPEPKEPQKTQSQVAVKKSEPEQEGPAALNWYLFLLLALIPLLFFLIKHRHIFSKHGMRLFASIRPSKKLSALDATLKNIENSGQHEKLYYFFTQALEIKYAVPAGQITESLMEQALLKTPGWDREKVDAFLDFMAICAQVHFGAQQTAVDGKTLIKKAQYWFLMFKQN